MTKLSIIRKKFTQESTIGEMRIEEIFFSYTLEDPMRMKKIYGKTAIPAGTYKVMLDMSNHFKRILPRLLDVPKFEGVRIHAGNTATDTDGCILIGFERGNNVIWKSKTAEEKLVYVLTGESDIEISIS